MKTLHSSVWSWPWIIMLLLVAAAVPTGNVLAQSCCDSANESNHEAHKHAAQDQSDVPACSAHGDLGLPESPTGRMVHAFID